MNARPRVGGRVFLTDRVGAVLVGTAYGKLRDTNAYYVHVVLRGRRLSEQRRAAKRDGERECGPQARNFRLTAFAAVSRRRRQEYRRQQLRGLHVIAHAIGHEIVA